MADRDKLDRNVRELVYFLNLLPGIRTYASCGGHGKLNDRVNPVPKGEFYVSLIVPVEDPDGSIEKSLSVIRDAAKVFEGKITFERDAEEEGFPVKDGHCSWTINGKGIRPLDFAIVLLSEEGGRLEKEVDALIERRGW